MIRAIGLAVSGMACIHLLASCQDTPASSPLHEDPYRNAPLHVSNNVRIVLYDSSVTQAVITAGTATIDEDRRVTMLRGGVHVTLYNAVTGSQTAVLDAEEADIDDATQDMVATGNVVFVSDSTATTLRTPRVHWNHAQQQLQSEAAVEITTPREHLYGIGFRSDQYLSEYRIYNVRGIRQ